MADPAPVIREGHAINRAMEHLVMLTPIRPPAQAAPRAPTPLDVRRTAVTQALHRAARSPRAPADLRLQAARSRTVIPVDSANAARPATTPRSSTPTTAPAPPRHH